jgi:hypothetical protein
MGLCARSSACPVVSPRRPQQIIGAQIDPICTPQLMSIEAALAAPNGGSASVLPDLFGYSA